jgi:SAM-dependent methyltransferase
VTTTTQEQGQEQFDELAPLYERFCDFWESVDPTVQGWVSNALTYRYKPASSPARGLDIGCGTGRYTMLMHPFCTSVLGIDPSGDMLTLAVQTRLADNVRYVRSTLGDLDPTAVGMFDLIVSVRTLHHTGDPDVMLPKVKSLLMPGGRLVVVDMVDPGGWASEEFHRERADRMAHYAAVATHDASAAAITTDLLLHPQWLSSVVQDIPMNRAQFHATYGRVFPGCVLYQFDSMTEGVLWDAPRLSAAATPNDLRHLP